jgi:hypothetical protein|tara:strand:- start:7354 stop:8277 length:924 start_codon:yes stop_codon:yes gene_type:complete
MSDSDWRRSYTIGLIIVGLAAAGFAYWLWSSTEASHFQIEQEAREGADAYTDPRNIAVEGECLALPEAERGDCITTEREASYQGQRNERDLEAQRVMAAWTRAIGIATIVGMAFGIFGLSLIFVTFREARRAADAGFAANKIAREANENQLRAWVQIHIVQETRMATGTPPSPRFFTKLAFETIGQSPAKNVTYTSWPCIGYEPTETELENWIADREANGFIENIFHGSRSNEDAQIEHSGAVPQKPVIGFMIFAVSYQTVFSDEVRETVRVFRLNDANRPDDLIDFNFPTAGLQLVPWEKYPGHVT